MFGIRATRALAPGVKRFWVDAPRVATHWRPGQFVIVRASEDGERIPLTIAAGDANEGWISIIVQAIGASTNRINSLEEGDSFADVAGPLGAPSNIRKVGTVAVIGGGVGTAIAYPTAVAYHEAGNTVIGIVGGRSGEYVILEDELRKSCDEVYVLTDDGSYGRQGLVTDALGDILASGRQIDEVLAIGPIPMMRAVAAVTREYGVHTVVSLNPIMVDGTGMCGGCRVLVGGETKFACVDGPEFDAHLVDFDVLTMRNKAYHAFEQSKLEQSKLEQCVSRVGA
jgi:ferredoxin--NADP+ reductase